MKSLKLKHEGVDLSCIEKLMSNKKKFIESKSFILRTLNYVNYKGYITDIQKSSIERIANG
jgi:hypothetical protein